MNSKTEKLLRKYKAPLVAASALVASGATFADYTTDVMPTFTATLTTLQSDAWAMFGDAVPFIIGIMSIGILISMARSMISKMRA